MSIQNEKKSGGARWLIVVGLVAGAFLGAYGLAAAKSGNSSGNAYAQNGSTLSGAPAGATGAGGSGSGSGGGCACCGSSVPTKDGLSGDKVEGSATLEGDVQKISVDVSSGTYNPNVIKLKAGVPAEITFANGTGCTGQVMSNELNFFEDMSNGPVTVKLPAQSAGEYPFYCGMQMVYGKIVVE